MAKSAQAKRTNRLLGLAAVLLIGVGVAAWATGDTSGTPSGSPDTTVPSDGGTSAGTSNLLRSADTSLSWFNHSNSVEQFDYEMPKLSCTTMATYITTDLCAVVRGGSGTFMVVGTEGYWDPNDADSNGNVRIPLDLTVYVLTDANGPSRAMSVLDGSVSVNYDDAKTYLSAYTLKTDAGEVLVLHKRPASQEQASYDFWDELQIVAMSPKHSPELVAAYEGSNIHFIGKDGGITFSADRYASPTGAAKEPTWSSLFSLSPVDSFPYYWTESVVSGKSLNHDNHEMPVLVDTYKFPNSGLNKANA